MSELCLHRFPLSHFSEKGRALLDFKGLEYRVAEHQLGLDQINVWRLSGQRKVPVLEHDGAAIADSTEIALYLERCFPERRRLLPDDPARRREVLELEDRIDRVLGMGAPVVWFAAIATDRELVARALDAEVFGVGPLAAGVLARVIGAGHGIRPARAVYARAARATRKLLVELCERLQRAPYLGGDEPGLADVAAVGLAFHLEFPRSRFLGLPDLAGRGVAGWADDPELGPFFAWRRRFYEEYLQ